MRTIFVILFLLSFNLASANEQFASVSARQSLNNSWLVHLIWVGELDTLSKNSIEEHSFEEADLDHAIALAQTWLANKIHSNDTLVLLCDPYNLNATFAEKWKKQDYVEFREIRKSVRDRFGDASFGKKIGINYEYTDKKMSKTPFDAYLKYLVHSHPMWVMRKRDDGWPHFIMPKNTLKVLRSQNFEQLRAYLWSRKIFLPDIHEHRQQYWIAIYTGYMFKEVYFTPGKYLLEDCGVVTDAKGEVSFASGGEGVVVDVYPFEKETYSFFCIATPEIGNRRGVGGFWEHDNVDALHKSVNEFFADLDRVQ